MIGVKDGNFHPTSQPREEFLKTLMRAKEKHLPPHMPWIFGPWVQFSNRVAHLHEDDDSWTTGDSWPTGFVRTRSPADGGIVTGPLTGIAIFNGDCPLVFLQQNDQLAVLHAGYRCLIRADQDGKNVIESAIEYFDPKQTHAWIQGGVGPCCWLPEYDDKPEILEPKRSRRPELLAQCLGRTTQSPAGPGHVSVDLYALARGLLLQVGVPEENISWDTTCTCCAMENGEPPYWSYTRFKSGKQDVDGRNFSIAWLEQQ
ncbi:MAG: hypothetical protein G01um101438_166 [Parcubacteria group bacterium Gr01-1014_38]|nr:MAG: hypothetical protein G01um101438_166 [Parcubacteria group bacterium Gr01-1014_38]